MATFVEFELAAANAALDDVFDRLPSCYCRMEQTAASDVPGLWFGGVERSALESAFETDPTVDAYSLVDAAGDEWLYEIRFAPDACDIYENGSVLFEEGGTILAASATRGTWSVRMRFAERESATRIYRRLLERDIDVEVASLRERSTAGPERLGLTTEQYEAIVTAIERGYYEVPREVSITELADEFDISDQSVSERLRRAISRLLSAEFDEADARSRADDQ